MNRLILLGNGFDLAHGLKTSYKDFVLWYLKQGFGKAWWTIHGYEDELIEIKRTPDYMQLYDINHVHAYIDHHYEAGLDDLFHNRQPIFNVAFKSEFWKGLLMTCAGQNWVDIENEYYEKLKQCLNGSDKAAALAEVNSALEKIIALLKQYLETINPPAALPGYKEIFNSPVYAKDWVSKRAVKDESPSQSLTLNFNYTNTVERYFSPSQINYIHGKLDDTANPLIFGFGDELDESYLKMEQEKTKGFLKYIKSFRYFKTSNYHNFLRFIESGEFQVFIMGHSCGLSDRTMLNMIFEHENCKSIKIFYHNNYTELTEEISRHFKNKTEMRKKIVPFTRSIPMPQL